MHIIEFENIDVGYDEKVVLKDINLKIKSGEHFAILGANGSGNTFDDYVVDKLEVLDPDRLGLRNLHSIVDVVDLHRNILTIVGDREMHLRHNT